MKINIIVDNKNSWFMKYILELSNVIKKDGHIVNIYSDQRDIKEKTDISFFLSYEGYITKSTRLKSNYNIVVHASNLPSGKGMSPATWQILEGKNEIPVTLFEVADKIDAGDFYIKYKFLLNGTELIDQWQEKLYVCIKKMIIDFIKNIKTMKPKKQNGKQSIYKKRGPEDSELDINKTIKSQFNLLRVVDNEKYPAFFKYKGNKYIIKIYKS